MLPSQILIVCSSLSREYWETIRRHWIIVRKQLNVIMIYWKWLTNTQNLILGYTPLVKCVPQFNRLKMCTIKRRKTPNLEITNAIKLTNRGVQFVAPKRRLFFTQYFGPNAAWFHPFHRVPLRDFQTTREPVWSKKKETIIDTLDDCIIECTLTTVELIGVVSTVILIITSECDRIAHRSIGTLKPSCK